MKINDLKKKLKKDRPMSSVTLRMPEDVINDLKKIAPLLGFSGYQPLIRSYIGKCLREDLENIDNKLNLLIITLIKQGVNKDSIKQAIVASEINEIDMELFEDDSPELMKA